MPDIDPATAYRTLTDRAAALRAEADAARKQSVASDQDDDRRIGLRRDELDRERGALGRDAELADAQVKELEEQRQAILKMADDFQADIASGKADGALGSTWQRNVEEGRAAAEQLADRAAAARADAAATRERLAGVDRKLVDLDEEVRVTGEENQGARMAIFALDDQARYVDEAARRYGEAAAAGDDIPERAAKELAAEQALRNADRTSVDRDAIRRVIPTFPDQTPGLDEHPWPPAPPVIGPEETLDPFAIDADTTAGDDRAVAATDTTAFGAIEDASNDDGSTAPNDLAAGAGDETSWLDQEAAGLGIEPTAAPDTSGFDDPNPGTAAFVAGSADESHDGIASDEVASSIDPVGGEADIDLSYESTDTIATETTDGDDAAATVFADPAAGYADDTSTDAPADYSSDGAADYSSPSTDSSYDDGSVG